MVLHARKPYNEGTDLSVALLFALCEIHNKQFFSLKSWPGWFECGHVVNSEDRFSRDVAIIKEMKDG